MSESQISETQQTNMTVDTTLTAPTTLPHQAHHDDDDKQNETAWLGSFWQVEGWDSDHLKQLELVAEKGYTEETHWTTLQTLIKNRIKQNLASFLSTSFPHAGSSRSAVARRRRRRRRRQLGREKEKEEGVLAPATQYPKEGENEGKEAGVSDDHEDDGEDDDEDDEDDKEEDEDEGEAGGSITNRTSGKRKTYGPEELVPSTQGGLVIPPFPPLKSRDRGGSQDHSQTSLSSPASSQAGPSTPGSSTRSFGTNVSSGRPPLSPRSNSGPYQTPVHTPLSPGFSSGSEVGVGPGTGMGDPMYDREAAIGGKVLSGKVRPREAEGMLEGIWRLVDEFERDPPFTVQRLCELAAHPRRQHTLLGKYVRALERVLLVTSPFEFPPSSGGEPGLSGVQPGTDRPGVPPGLALERPLFGLIPFLQPQDGEMAVMPGTSAAAAVGGGAGGMGTGVEPSSSSLSSSTSSLDPTNDVEPTEPFLGRVDELDAGPLIKPSPDPTHSGGTSSQDPHQLHDVKEGGGGVILHGVSDRPRAISSTTDLSMLDDGAKMGGYRDQGSGDDMTDSMDEQDDHPGPGFDGNQSDSSVSSLVSSTSTNTNTNANTNTSASARSGSMRRISRLPRTTSTQSLTDRFVSTGMEVLDTTTPAATKEEEARSSEKAAVRSGLDDTYGGIKVDEGESRLTGKQEDGQGDELKDEVEMKREEEKEEEEENVKTGLPVKIRRVE